MGVVFRAYDTRLRGEVALKLLPEHLAHDATFIERFRREARATFELNAPHVVPVLDYGDINGRLYISMQLINGHDLGQLLEVTGPLNPMRAVRILRQAAHGLGAAHARNLIHRDVKPSNLLVVEHNDDFTYLADFGVAHVIGKSTTAASLTMTGATIGTIDYIAPERLLLRSDTDGRVDVYSLACVFFEMLTGRRPFAGDAPPALIAAHLYAPPPRVTDLRPDLSQRWDDLIRHGMAKDPDERHTTALEFADDARGVLEGQPAAPPTVVPSVPAPRSASDTYVPRPLSRGSPNRPSPARSPRSRSGMVGWLVAALIVSLLIVLTTVAVATVRNGGQVGASPATTPTDSPATAALESPQAPPSPSATGPGELPQTPVNGDLGLSTPLTSVPCDGSYALFVGAAVIPANYRAEVQAYLGRYPGSSYLLAEQNCTSLRHHMDNGASVYTVYYGPYPTLAQACEARSRVGGDSFIRRLDNSTPVGQEPRC
jgi:serine/threonine-protein kinase